MIIDIHLIQSVFVSILLFPQSFTVRVGGGVGGLGGGGMLVIYLTPSSFYNKHVRIQSIHASI